MWHWCLHRIIYIVVLLIILGSLWICSFAINGFSSECMARLSKNFFGTLFIFEKNKTEWTSFLFDFIHGCFDLSDLNDQTKWFSRKTC